MGGVTTSHPGADSPSNPNNPSNPSKTPALDLLEFDRGRLLKLGVKPDTIDRVYRALWIYSSGFHDTIR